MKQGNKVTQHYLVYKHQLHNAISILKNDYFSTRNGPQYFSPSHPIYYGEVAKMFQKLLIASIHTT